jgi:hypothetical protein
VAKEKFKSLRCHHRWQFPCPLPATSSELLTPLKLGTGGGTCTWSEAGSVLTCMRLAMRQVIFFFFFFAGAGGGERGRKRYWGLNSGPHTVNPVCVTKPFGIHVKSKHPFSKHRFKSIK